MVVDLGHNLENKKLIWFFFLSLVFLLYAVSDEPTLKSSMSDKPILMVDCFGPSEVDVINT